MATVKASDKNNNFECFYDDLKDNSTFLLTLNTGKFGGVMVRIDKYDLENLKETILQFDENMEAAGAIKSLNK